MSLWGVFSWNFGGVFEGRNPEKCTFAKQHTEGVGGVQGALTLFCGGVKQAFHDDRVVELKGQLVVEELDGRRKEGKIKEEKRGRIKENAPWIWPWMTKCLLKTWAKWGVRWHQVWKSASSAHDVHYASVCVNVVIGVLVVHCELHVDVRVLFIPLVVYDDAVIDLTLVLIALVVIVVFVVAILHRILLYWRFSVFTPPSVTVNCCWLSPNIATVTFAPNWFWESCLELLAQSPSVRFPRSIGAGSVFVVMLRCRIPPGFLPVPQRWGITFPSLLMSCIFLVPPIVAVHTNFFFSNVVRVVFVRQFVHLTTYFFTATQFNHGLSESSHHGWTGREYPRNVFFLHILLERIRDEVLVIAQASSRNGARGVILSWCSNWESKGDRECTWRISCSPPFHLARSARTCSRQCRRPSTTDTFFTVLWVAHRVVRIIRCSQLHESCLSILSWKGWMVDVVEDRFEVLVDEGGSRSSESRFERWRHVIVLLSNLALLECWSQCSPRWLHGWTRCPRWMTQCHDVLQEQIVLSQCVCLRLISQVAVFHREHAWQECLQTDCQVSLIDLKNQVLCANVYHRSRVKGTFFLYPQTHVLCPGFLDRAQIGLGLDWVSWENAARWTSPRDCWTSLPTGCCSTVEPNWSFPLVQLWSCLNEIFGGGRGDTYGLSCKNSPVFNLSTFGMQ